jgi:sulfide:quinone oxidoreductase
LPGLEAALALRELAGDRVETTVLTPEETFEVKALSVREPFARPRAHRHRLADLAEDIGFTLRHGALASVDTARKVVVDGEAASTRTTSCSSPSAHAGRRASPTR